MTSRVLVLGSLLPSLHCFQYLCEEVAGCEIVGLVPHQTPPRLREDQNSANYAEAKGIPVLRIEELEELEFDLGLSLMFDRPLAKSIVDRPPKGFVNIHLGPLPRLRGSNSVLHAIRLAPLDGIWTFGITMHYMVAAVDQGPIIDSVEFPIFRDDTAASLHSRAVDHVFPLFVRNIHHLIETPGQVSSVEQNGEAHFFRKGEIEHFVDITADPALVLAQIRALSFPGRPRPYIVVGDERVYLTLDES